MKLSELLDYMIIVCLLRLKAIAAQDKAKTERRYACWGSFGPPVVSAQCPRNTVIHVISAGLKVQNQRGTCAYHDSDCGCDFEDFGCQIPDVRSLCMGKSACRLDVTQQYISKASCRGFSDYMYIEFECIPEKTEHRRHVCAPGSFNNKVGFLTSPNYPNKYPSNQYCECVLSTKSDLNVTVLDFHTNHHSCSGDRLIIGYNGQRITYCGNSRNSGQHIIPKGETMKLIFDTDSKPGSGGFWMKYQAESLVQVSCSVEQKIVQTTTAVPKTVSSQPKTVTNLKSTLPTTLITKADSNAGKKTPKPLNHDSTSATTQNPDDKSKETRPGDQWWWKFTVKENGQSKFLFSTPSADEIDNAIDTFPHSQERPLRGDRPFAEMLTPRIPHSRNDHPQNPNMSAPIRFTQDSDQGMNSLSEESTENLDSISDNNINSASHETSENLLNHAKSLNIPSDMLKDLSSGELEKLIEIYKDISPIKQSSEYLMPDSNDKSYFMNLDPKNVNSFKVNPPHELQNPDMNMIPHHPNQQGDTKDNSINHLSEQGYSEEKMAMQDPDGMTSNEEVGGSDAPPTMATIIAACVIGSVLLIIVIGLIVKFVTKRTKARNNHRFHQRRKMNQERRGNPHLARGMAGKTFA